MVSTEVKASRSRPIIFSGAMVRAIVEGKKTQTRRIHHPKMIYKPCPYGVTGDSLWVRETFCEIEGKLIYKASAPKGFRNPGSWTPSILMPRENCRLQLKILDTWVEPLNSISEEDAIAEGIIQLENGRHFVDGINTTKASEAFKMLWEKINGTGSWEINPMVWVIEFEGLHAMNPIRLRLETMCFFWELNLGIRDDWDSYYPDSQKVMAINFHFYITLPSFQPDHQHIQWVKAAYGLTPQKPWRKALKKVAQRIETDEEYDPIPF